MPPKGAVSKAKAPKKPKAKKDVSLRRLAVDSLLHLPMGPVQTDHHHLLAVLLQPNRSIPLGCIVLIYCVDLAAQRAQEAQRSIHLVLQ